jgi:hypothetical protein
LVVVIQFPIYLHAYSTAQRPVITIIVINLNVIILGKYRFIYESHRAVNIYKTKLLFFTEQLRKINLPIFLLNEDLCFSAAANCKSILANNVDISVDDLRISRK